jgi:hypothetical protein
MDIPIQAYARDCTPGVDTDVDTFNDDVECYLNTDPSYGCPLWTDADVGGPGQCPGEACDGHDAHPLDINVDRYMSVVGDILHFRGHVGAAPGSPEWWQRLDFNKDDYLSVVGDVLLFRGNIGECVEDLVG